MIYGSVCSGIEAATVAWHSLGWQPAWFTETAAQPSAVLQHHYPAVRNHGDFTQIQAEAGSIDLLAGGTPCQDFSIAGLRAGLDGDRGNLALQFFLLAQRTRPRWLLWENVPGVFSINGGRDFAAILGAMAELGYGFAWRVLDAQFVRVDGYARAVPQRRQRVFVVGYLGDWRRAAAVLFERESLSGNPAPGRKAREGIAAAVAPSLTGSGRGVERSGDSRGQDPVVAEYVPSIMATALTSKMAKGTCGPAGDEHHNLIAFDSKASGRSGFGVGDVSPPLRAMNHDGSQANAGGQVAVAFDLRGREGGAQFEGPHDTANIRAASGGSSRSYIAEDWRVRRLTPREAERLQGFPDDWTLVPYRGKPMADGPRYKMLGNSMACNVMRWIGARIAMVDDIGKTP